MTQISPNRPLLDVALPPAEISGLSTGAIIAIVAAVVIGAVAVVLIIRAARKKKSQSSAPPADTPQ